MNLSDESPGALLAPEPPPEHGESARRGLRLPPQDIQAERALLGAVLIDNRVLDTIRQAVNKDDFFREAHRLVFDAMAALSEKGDPVDELTVTQQLRSSSHLEQAGGAAAITALAQATPTSAHVAAYARIVRDCAIRRRVKDAATAIVEDAIRAEGDVKEFVDRAESSIFAVCDDPTRHDYKHIGKVVLAAFKKLEDAANRGQAVTGVPTGFSKLDHMTAGLQPSDLVIVAGRPSMGKTAFTLNLASCAALRHKQPTVIFSLEMSAEQLAMRLLGAEARVDLSLLRTGRLYGDDWTKLGMAAGKVSEAPLFIDDSGILNVFDVRTKCRRIKREHGLGLVIIDYLQLMSGSREADNRVQEISEISRGLKAIARELNVPVVALSQLNRGLESRPDKRPLLSDLRESGAIEQDADVIMFLYRDEYYNKDNSPKKGIAEVIIGKQRNGPVGTVELAFLPKYTRFENLADEPG